MSPQLAGQIAPSTTRSCMCPRPAPQKSQAEMPPFAERPSCFPTHSFFLIIKLGSFPFLSFRDHCTPLHHLSRFLGPGELPLVMPDIHNYYSCELFHACFNALLYSTYHNFFVLVHVLQKIQNETYIKMRIVTKRKLKSQLHSKKRT